MNMASAYRILKLNTGEEIITRIQKRQKGKVYMESPMSFRTVLMSDPMTGMQREITMLKDWVSYSSDNFVKIPENIVISYSSPADEAVSLYEKEKERKLKTKKRELKNFDSFQKDMLKDVNEFIDNLIDQSKNYQDENPDEVNDYMTIKDIFEQIKSHNSDQEIEWEFEFQFPPEEISDETTEGETNHPDYGNRWTDWSSDPREY